MVLFFMDLSTLPVEIAGISARPASARSPASSARHTGHD
jgi:hypothetical protein